MANKNHPEWEVGVKPGLLDLGLKELWEYKDLLFRMVRKELLVNYQQTVLGPLWIIIQPILTTLVYYLIFGRVVKVSTDGIPPILFYLSGIIIWSYFFDCLSDTMYTFSQHSSLFSKVYFPRLVMPLSSMFAHMIRISVQLVLFIIAYFIYQPSAGYSPGFGILLFPLIVILTGLYGLAAGLWISVLTFRYRDLGYALQFILRLYMFASPVVYPASLVPQKLEWLFWLNPMTSLIELFRSLFFEHSQPEAWKVAWCFMSIGILLLTGMILFKRNEQKAIDVV